MTFTIQFPVQDFLIYQLKNLPFITKQTLLNNTGQIIYHLQQMQFGIRLKVKEAKQFQPLKKMRKKLPINLLIIIMV